MSLCSLVKYQTWMLNKESNIFESCSSLLLWLVEDTYVLRIF